MCTGFGRMGYSGAYTRCTDFIENSSFFSARDGPSLGSRWCLVLHQHETRQAVWVWFEYLLNEYFDCYDYGCKYICTIVDKSGLFEIPWKIN